MIGLANRMSLSLGSAQNGVSIFVNNIFTSTWDTENLGGTGSPTKVILLPYAGGNTTDWGDGTINTSNTHTYSVGGIKTIKIEGSVTGFQFAGAGDKSKILTVPNTGELVISHASMFEGCNNLTMFLANPDMVVTVTSLSRMFFLCSSLTSFSFSSADTSLVTNMSTMFGSCTSLASIDLSSLSTVSVTNFSFMFFQDINLTAPTGVDDFDVALGTDMTQMFDGVTLDTSFYSSLLVNYEAQAVQSNVVFHGGSSLYSAGAAATARADLIADHTWTITDGGLEP